MPDLGDELHHGWFERVFACDADVHLIMAAFVWCIGWSTKVAFQVCEVGDFFRVLRRGDANAGVNVLVDVLDLLLQTAVAVGGRHVGLSGGDQAGVRCSVVVGERCRERVVVASRSCSLSVQKRI